MIASSILQDFALLFIVAAGARLFCIATGDADEGRRLFGALPDRSVAVRTP